MKWLRLYLITVSILGIIAIVVAMKSAVRSYISLPEILIGLAVGFTLLANLIYIADARPDDAPKTNGRLRRLFSLWIDAKETELERRAKSPTARAD